MNEKSLLSQTNYTLTPKESNAVSIYKLLLTVFVLFLHSYSEQINLASGSITFTPPHGFGTLNTLSLKSLPDVLFQAFFFCLRFYYIVIIFPGTKI